jgi:hypothetical protein
VLVWRRRPRAGISSTRTAPETCTLGGYGHPVVDLQRLPDGPWRTPHRTVEQSASAVVANQERAVRLTMWPRPLQPHHPLPLSSAPILLPQSSCPIFLLLAPSSCFLPHPVLVILSAAKNLLFACIAPITSANHNPAPPNAHRPGGPHRFPQPFGLSISRARRPGCPHPGGRAIARQGSAPCSDFQRILCHSPSAALVVSCRLRRPGGWRHPPLREHRRCAVSCLRRFARVLL